jgi:methionyl aminopeptidase
MNKIKSNTITSQNTQNTQLTQITHGNWKFDFNQKNNVYLNDLESFDKKVFNSKKYNTSEENNTELTEKDLDDFRRAALIHKVARKKALSMLYSGGKLADLVDSVENIIIKLCKQNPDTYFNYDSKNSDKVLKSGIAFPVGVNINNVVAHDSKTTNILDDRKFYKGDVVKVDIGVHVNGRIIDSAFTHIITDKPGIHDDNNIYNSVLEASRESVFSTIKLAGPGQRLDELSEYIDEIISSYEVDIGGNSLEIKPVKNIGGHNIEQYRIHAGKLILSKPDYDVQKNTRMEEGEVYAIETYASTGYGVMTQNDSLVKCTHYMETDKNIANITKKDKKRFSKLEMAKWLKTRNGLPFSSSWINDKMSKREKSFRVGLESNILTAYPPLYDEENSVVAQFEHTIHIKDGSVEIFSLDKDY